MNIQQPPLFDDSAPADFPPPAEPGASWDDLTVDQRMFIQDQCLRCNELHLIGDALDLDLVRIFATHERAATLIRRWYAIGVLRSREHFAGKAARDTRLMGLHYTEFIKRLSSE